ncbi:MAG: hypothetical protein E7256_17125 [Lachnospiraceae bacterium]|nr:hypothetical protein [Lachnospiraceae bacterium]
MQCSCCGSENNSTKDFCQECGHSLLKTSSLTPYATYTSRNAELLKLPFYLSIASMFFLFLQVVTISISSAFSGTTHALYLFFIIPLCGLDVVEESFATILLLIVSFFYLSAFLLQARFCHLCLTKDNPKIHLQAHRIASKFTCISAITSMAGIPLAGLILSSSLYSTHNVIDLFFLPHILLLVLTCIGKTLIYHYYTYAIHHPGNSLSRVRALTKRAARQQSI